MHVEEIGGVIGDDVLGSVDDIKIRITLNDITCRCKGVNNFCATRRSEVADDFEHHLVVRAVDNIQMGNDSIIQDCVDGCVCSVISVYPERCAVFPQTIGCHDDATVEINSPRADIAFLIFKRKHDAYAHNLLRKR